MLEELKAKERDSTQIAKRKCREDIYRRHLMRNGVQRKTLSIIDGDALRRWLPDQGIPLPRSNIAKTPSSSWQSLLFIGSTHRKKHAKISV
jgi:hypothetical protein